MTPEPSKKRCTVYCTAQEYTFETLVPYLKERYHCEVAEDSVYAQETGRDAHSCYFPYGAVVFWGYEEEEEAALLKNIKAYELRPLERGEDDEFLYHYGQIDRLHRDVVCLSSRDHLKKMAVSHGLAQSTKLSVFEKSVQKTIANTHHLPENLAAKGKIALGQKEISKLMGALFLERSSVNLHFDLLDTPEFFWEFEEVEPLYQRTRHYLDIPSRLEVLNTRLDIVHDLFEMLGNQLNHQHSSFLEWIIIWLIAIEVVLYLGKDLFHLI